MKKFTLIVLALFLAGEVSALPLFGTKSRISGRREIWVDDGGSIAAAVLAAKDGDVVCLCPGTYTTYQLNINKKINFVAERFGSVKWYGVGASATADSLITLNHDSIGFTNIVFYSTGYGTWVDNAAMKTGTSFDHSGVVAKTWLSNPTSGVIWKFINYCLLIPTTEPNTATKGWRFQGVGAGYNELDVKFSRLGHTYPGIEPDSTFYVYFGKGTKGSWTGFEMISGDDHTTMPAGSATLYCDSINGLTLINCRIQGSSSDNAGAVRTDGWYTAGQGSVLAILNTPILGGSATVPAIYVCDSTAVNLSGCSVAGNTSGIALRLASTHTSTLYGNNWNTTVSCSLATRHSGAATDTGWVYFDEMPLKGYVDYTSSATVKSHVYIEHGHGQASFVGSSLTRAVLIRGLASASYVIVSPYEINAGDIFTTVTTDTLTVTSELNTTGRKFNYEWWR